MDRKTEEVEGDIAECLSSRSNFKEIIPKCNPTNNWWCHCLILGWKVTAAARCNLRHEMIHQVKNECQLFRLVPWDDNRWCCSGRKRRL